jgi:hypothetical protein
MTEHEHDLPRTCRRCGSEDVLWVLRSGRFTDGACALHLVDGSAALLRPQAAEMLSVVDAVVSLEVSVHPGRARATRRAAYLATA